MKYPSYSFLLDQDLKYITGAIEVNTEDIDFTNEATIKFAESKETFEIIYNEQKGVEGPLKLTGHLVEDRTWSLEMVGSSYHVSKGEFDNFETSSELQEYAKELISL
ncbi:15494_t:CDS:2 [Entrophospora sp. SA101]|nr:15494_t:CDS:2 [Entrophospora sp. SA101]